MIDLAWSVHNAAKAAANVAIAVGAAMLALRGAGGWGRCLLESRRGGEGDVPASWVPSAFLASTAYEMAMDPPLLAATGRGGTLPFTVAHHVLTLAWAGALAGPWRSWVRTASDEDAGGGLSAAWWAAPVLAIAVHRAILYARPALFPGGGESRRGRWAWHWLRRAAVQASGVQFGVVLLHGVVTLGLPSGGRGPRGGPDPPDIPAIQRTIAWSQVTFVSSLAVVAAVRAVRQLAGRYGVVLVDTRTAEGERALLIPLWAP